MWLWLLILLAPIQLPFSFQPPAIAAESGGQGGASTSSGPVSNEESAVLWREGRKAFEQGRYQDAVNNFQRLVDRYPGYPGYLEAHRYLGRSLMLVGRPEDAEQPLKEYVNATGDQPMALQTRLWLGEDYLMMSEPSEAYLDAVGVEKLTRKGGKAANPKLYAESQFLKTRALMAKDDDTRAQRVLDSVALDSTVQSDPVLKGHLARTQIELKLRSCARLPGKGRMNDGQAREQFAKRALCLQEALVLFKDAAESGDLQTANDAENRIAEAYKDYAKAVHHPPEPPKLKPVDRTAVQKRQYRAELSDRLERDRRKAVLDALDTLSGWRAKARSAGTPSETAAAGAFAELSRKISGSPGVYQ